MQNEVEVLAVTAEPATARHVLSVTAAVGVEVDLHPDVGVLRPRWRSAAVVIVGVDLAGEVAALALPRRSGVYVVGAATDRDLTHVWSARLGAAVVTLPEGAGDLASAIADLTTRGGVRRTWCVVGGSGGVGTSTLAAGLAITAARSGVSTLLVDADPDGGGIDLLLGAEHVEGWRWPRLAAARGHLGDLGGQLPPVEGVAVLSMDRTVGGPLLPDQLEAVLRAGSRSHDLTVVDLPRHADEAGDVALRRADEVLLVVRADVRGVAAGRQVAERIRPVCRSLSLVVRLGRPRALTAASVADAVELPLVGTVDDDPALATGAERGVPPGRVPRSSLARVCRRLLAPMDVRSVA